MADIALNPIRYANRRCDIQNSAGKSLARSDDMHMITAGIYTAEHQPRDLIGRETAGRENATGHEPPKILRQSLPDRHG